MSNPAHSSATQPLSIRPFMGKKVDGLEVKKYLENATVNAPRPFKPEGLAHVKTENFAIGSSTEAKLDQKPLPFFTQNPVGDSTQYPFCTIGLVSSTVNGNTLVWSGVLIEKNVMLTEGSFLPWANQSNATVQFTPGYSDGAAPFGVANVIEGWGYDAPNPTDNYVVCRLDIPIGNQTGWMGWWTSTGSNEYSKSSIWNCVGYPGGGIQIGVFRIGIDKVENKAGGGSKQLDTAVFADSGWYGGPFWTDNALPGTDVLGPYVVAVLVGWGIDFPGNQYQVSEGGPDMGSLVIYAINHWES